MAREAGYGASGLCLHRLPAEPRPADRQCLRCGRRDSDSDPVRVLRSGRPEPAIEEYSDDYRNNQFVGTWTSYKTGVKKVANWGICRIPCSGDLDWGAAEFSPAPEYRKYGWEDYKP